MLSTTLWGIVLVALGAGLVWFLTDDARARERLIQAFKLSGGGARRIFASDNHSVMGFTPTDKAIVIARKLPKMPLSAKFYGPERVFGAQLELNGEIIDVVAPPESAIASVTIVPYAHADSDVRRFCIRLFVDDPHVHELRFPTTEADAEAWLSQIGRLIKIDTKIHTVQSSLHVEA